MFSSKRLMYRAFDPERDGNKFLQNRNNADFMNFMSNEPRVPTSGAQFKELTEQRAKGGPLPFFAICLKPEDPENSWPRNLKPSDNYFQTAPDAIGFFGFNNEHFDFKNRTALIGISFADLAHRGKGYGGETLEWGLSYAFEELGLHKVGLQVYENNVGAIRCYEKVGFVTEGRLRKGYYHAARWWDIFCMGVLEEEYFEKKKKALEQMSTHPNGL